jgi:HK97 family phage major capsid protein
MTAILEDISIENGADPGDVIGYMPDGTEITLMGGAARNNYDAWVPEEYGSDVIMRINQVSVIERLATRVPMGSNTKSTPRSAGIGVDFTAKGAAYGEDVSANDQVILTAQKFTKAIRIAEEDLQDSLANIIATKQKDWATSYAKAIDNACLGVTATAVSTTVPFISVYAALTVAGTDATTGYVANTNLTQAGTAAPSYSGLNTAAKKLEVGDYFDESSSVAIAHPSFRGTLRGIVDNQGRPIFIETVTQDNKTLQTLFGIPLHWSLGCRTSVAATSTPPGNPLLIFANMEFAQLGIRSGPESAFAPADSGVGFLTDEALLKLRARRGFAVGNQFAFSVYDNNSGL